MKREVRQLGVVQVTTEAVTAAQPVLIGLQALQLDPQRDALLYVPPGYVGTQPAPLAIMLHGAGGNAQLGMALLQPVADAFGIILLAPFSRGRSWDVLENKGYGTDVIFISQALQQVLNRYAINLNKLAIGGFSDGASYALSLGLINGNLFTHILAFSPGFYFAPHPSGRPQIYISHGVHDPILSITTCSRRIVPRLKNLGYPVFYHEFDGEHCVPQAVRIEAVEWFLDTNKYE